MAATSIPSSLQAPTEFSTRKEDSLGERLPPEEVFVRAQVKSQQLEADDEPQGDDQNDFGGEEAASCWRAEVTRSRQDPQSSSTPQQRPYIPDVMQRAYTFLPESSLCKCEITVPDDRGYDEEFVHPLSDKHVCSCCSLALRMPVQTPCGHLYCRRCLEKVLRSANPRCPQSQKPVTEVYPDNFTRREILALLVKCRNHNKNCVWQGSLQHLLDHMAVCPMELVDCLRRECTQKVPRSKLQHHFTEECLFREDECIVCREIVPLIRMKEHQRDYCQETLKECTQGCGTFIKRRLLQTHIKEDCIKAEIPCSYSKHGCRFKGNRLALNNHNEESDSYHLDLCRKAIDEKTHTIQELRANQSRQKEVIDVLVPKIARLETSLSSHFATKAQLRELQVQMDSLLANSLAGSSGGHHQFGQLAAKAESCEVNLSVLQNQVQKLVKEQEGMRLEPAKQAEQLSALENRLCAVEHVNYDGKLVWRLENISEVLLAAKRGEKVSVYSPAFYVGRYGYKFCARVYPNGDGTGRGSHLSLFVSLVKSEFDPLLMWPFRQRITLSVMDQGPSRRNINESFMPDSQSSSFQRPTSLMNVASGCPRLISHDLLFSPLHSYVKNNSVIFRITVDMTGLQQH